MRPLICCVLFTILALVPLAAFAQLSGDGAQARVEVLLDSGPGSDCRGQSVVTPVVDRVETVDSVLGALALAETRLPPWPALLGFFSTVEAASRAKWSVTGEGPIGARAAIAGFDVEHAHVIATAEYRATVRAEDPMNPGAVDGIRVDVGFALDGASTIVDFSGAPAGEQCARIYAQMDVDGDSAFQGEAVVESAGPAQPPTLRLGSMNDPLQGFELGDFSVAMIDTSFGPSPGFATQAAHSHMVSTQLGTAFQIAVVIEVSVYLSQGFEAEAINDHLDTLGLVFQAFTPGGVPLPGIAFHAISSTPPLPLALPAIVGADALAEKALNNPLAAFHETDSDTDFWNLTNDAFASAQAGTVPAGSGQGATAAVAEAELPAVGTFGVREVRVLALAAASGPPAAGAPPSDGGHSRAVGRYRLDIEPVYTGTGSPPVTIPIDFDIALQGSLGSFLVPGICIGCPPANLPSANQMTADVALEVFVLVGSARNRVFQGLVQTDRSRPPVVSGNWAGEPGFTLGPTSAQIDHAKLYTNVVGVPFGPFGAEIVVTAESNSDFTTTRFTRVDTIADFQDGGSLGVATGAPDVSLLLVVPEPDPGLLGVTVLLVLAGLRRIRA